MRRLHMKKLRKLLLPSSFQLIQLGLVWPWTSLFSIMKFLVNRLKLAKWPVKLLMTRFLNWTTFLKNHTGTQPSSCSCSETIWRSGLQVSSKSVGSLFVSFAGSLTSGFTFLCIFPDVAQEASGVEKKDAPPADEGTKDEWFNCCPSNQKSLCCIVIIY